MLDLRRDLFSRLVLSAQKDRSLNRPFKIVEIKDTITPTPSKKKPIKVVSVEHDISPIPKHHAETSTHATHRSKLFPIPKIEKIDEKVEKMISDPRIQDIKMELEVAEELLKKIKSIDKHNPKIPVIEQTISRMKTLLEQKSYV